MSPNHYPFQKTNGHCIYATPDGETRPARFHLPCPLGETTSHSTKLQKAAAKSLVIPQEGGGNRGSLRKFHANYRSAGFTLLEVLVALVIVGTALGASLRAVGSLTQNSSDLRTSMMATWSAENRLAQVRLAHEWPALGQRRFDCMQGELHLICEENVFTTPNPFFRRVEVSVFEAQNAERRIIKLSQVVPHV